MEKLILQCTFDKIIYIYKDYSNTNIIYIINLMLNFYTKFNLYKV